MIKISLADEYRVKDPSLAPIGKTQIEWAEAHMPVLRLIAKRLEKLKPFKGLRIAMCMHVTKETAVLAKALLSGGAEIWMSASNPLSTQDNVAAALAEMGVHVFAWRGMSKEQYYKAIGMLISSQPDVTMDDGADLTSTIHMLFYGILNEETRYAKEMLRDWDVKSIERILGGTEETTTGVLRLKALERNGKLLYPIVAVNDSLTKYLFDNRYGCGQSTLDGIMRATNILLAGKNVVVCGYGWVGRGIAQRARGMGANVIVVEVDPIKALEAIYDGFRVMSMREAARIGDIFITATGNRDVIRKEHFLLMKDGAVLANAGHFNVEISVPDLEEISVSKRSVRPTVDEYRLRDGKKLYLIAEGRLVNLVSAEGHPSEVMDMSFANQALAVEYLVKNKGKLKKKVYRLPYKIDERIARLKLKSLGVKIERLTKEQKEYLESWRLGT